MKHLSVASVLVVVIAFVVTFVVTAIDSIGSDYDIRISLVIAGVAALVAAIVVIFWVIPVHLILKFFNRSNLAWYILAAIVPGFAFVYALKPFGNDSNTTLLAQTLFCSFVGAIGATTFWYIAVFKLRITRRSGFASTGQFVSCGFASQKYSTRHNLQTAA